VEALPEICSPPEDAGSSTSAIDAEVTSADAADGAISPVSGPDAAEYDEDAAIANGCRSLTDRNYLGF
jgi:hypothetical protein